MSLAVIYTRAKSGINAPLVTVEVHLSNGLPSLSMVGIYNPKYLFSAKIKSCGFLVESHPLKWTKIERLKPISKGHIGHEII